MSALPMDNPDETDAIGSEVDADRVPLRALKPNEKTCTWNASQVSGPTMTTYQQPWTVGSSRYGRLLLTA